MIVRTAVAAVLVIAMGCATNKPTPAAKADEPLVEKPRELAPPAPTKLFQCDESDIDWPMFQRDAGRLGASEAPPIAAPRIAWSQHIGIASWLDNPLIAGGRVFAPSSGQIWNRPDGADGLYAFDLATGEPKWFAPTADDANGAAYDHCRVFVGSDAGTVTAVDARTGEQLWVAELGGKIYSNPLPLDHIVIVAGAPNLVAALDVATGEVVWKRDVGAAVRGGAAADDERIYVTTEAARVVALSSKDGRPIWSTEIASVGVKAAYSTPTVWGGKLYVAFVRDTTYDVPAVHMYDAASGKRTWDARNTQNLGGGWGNIRSSPALHDGQLYWGEAYSNRLVSLDATDGDVTTSSSAGYCMFPQWPSPAVAQDMVYVPRHDGGLYAYDIEKGAVRWSLYLGEANNISQAFPPEHLERGGERCDWEPPFGRPVYASPAVAADGTIVVSTGDGWVHAIRDSGAAP